MRKKSEKFKLISVIELFTGFILTLGVLILYNFKDRISALQEDSSPLIAILAIGIISLINSLVFYFLSKKAKEKEASPIEF